MSDFKCDYCNAESKNQVKVPDGWLKCRIRVSPEKSDYVTGPIACPYHRELLSWLFKNN